MSVVLLVVFLLSGCTGAERATQIVWQDTFEVDKSNLGPTGRNMFFVLEPGARSSFVNGDETLTITVLDETLVVDEVETRVVEEREEVDGSLLEISRNYFAIDRTTNDVYYFGEDVDIYENGQVVSHEGAWLSGTEGARFGLAVPAEPQVADRYYQEIAPGVALDRAFVVALDETVETPAGTFENCFHVEETTPLESGTSHKWYAPGIGLIRDDAFLLVETSQGQQ